MGIISRQILFTVVVTAESPCSILQTETHYRRVAEAAGRDGLADGKNAESNCGVGGAATAPYLDFSFANVSFTRGAKEESGASFKYSSHSLAISSSFPFPVSACATIKCEIANCLWSGREGTLRALARARSVSPFCICVLASAVRSCALFGWSATACSRYGSASLYCMFS